MDTYMRLFWVSYYTQFGSQEGTSILVPSNEDEYRYLEKELQTLYGDDFGGIADYGELEEVDDARE